MRKVFRISDVVRRPDDRANGEVTDKLPGNYYVVRWPDQTYSKQHATELQLVVGSS